MKKIENIKEPNFLKKLFIKLCRIIGFEIIDQSNLYLPTSDKLANKNLSGNDNTRRTYVIYESGLAPVREEVRLDIPTGDRNIPYVAAAFPKLAFQGQPVSMTVQAGNKADGGKVGTGRLDRRARLRVA